jgi:hypothetical protein
MLMFSGEILAFAIASRFLLQPTQELQDKISNFEASDFTAAHNVLRVALHIRGGTLLELDKSRPGLPVFGGAKDVTKFAFKCSFIFFYFFIFLFFEGGILSLVKLKIMLMMAHR